MTAEISAPCEWATITTLSFVPSLSERWTSGKPTSTGSPFMPNAFSSAHSSRSETGPSVAFWMIVNGWWKIAAR